MASLSSCSRTGFISLETSSETKSDTLSPLKTISIAAPKRAVDILLVIDNSASMATELANLGARFTNLARSLQGIDWQICLTTTDADSQAGNVIEWLTGVKVLNEATPNYETIFKNKLNSLISAEGSGFEQPIKSSNKAFLLATTTNAGCFRSGISKSIIIISDEDELSDGWTSRAGEESSGLNPTALNYPESLISTIKIQFPLSSFSVHAIAIKNDDDACLDSQRHQGGTFDYRSGYPAIRIGELTALAYGTVSSICHADYSEQLEQIGQSISSNLDFFELPCLSNRAEIFSVNYSQLQNQERTQHLEGSRLHFQPALGRAETAEVQFICH